MNNDGMNAASGQMQVSFPGLHQRLAWRPFAVKAADSMLSGILGGIDPLLNRVADLSEWHHQFTQRIQPWSGWTPMALDYSELAMPFDGDLHSTSTTVRVSDTFSEASPQRSSQKTVVKKPKIDRDREASPTRPAIKLAILGPNQTRTVDEPAVLGDVAAIPRYPPNRRLSEAPYSEFQSPLMMSVSSTPRQEIRGGLPIQQQAPLAAEVVLGKTQLDRSNPIRSATIHDARFATPKHATRAQSLVPKNQNMIEKLIEGTTRPVSLPGLELRPVLGQQQEASSIADRPSEGDASKQPSEEASMAGKSTPSERPVPQLDINAVADKVFQTLERRQQLERERRGLY